MHPLYALTTIIMLTCGCYRPTIIDHTYKAYWQMANKASNSKNFDSELAIEVLAMVAAIKWSDKNKNEDLGLIIQTERDTITAEADQNSDGHLDSNEIDRIRQMARSLIPKPNGESQMTIKTLKNFRIKLKAKLKSLLHTLHVHTKSKLKNS
tara:strand:- start:68 stop:523 length:456 start_codon:yes stop_codon:yes gene_type:complete